MKKSVVIIGAGPAGLSAAYEVIKQGGQPIVLEKADKVGGIARTESYKGHSFDIGGHRFFTKNESIQRLWHEMLGDDFLEVPRLSRIYYQGHFFNYPLRPLNALSSLGVLESLLIIFSYVKTQIWPYPEEETFEQWVSNHFGKRLYQTFFKTYTEKVWGMPCHQIRADWAAQRIKGLSLVTAVSNALFGNHKPRSLIDTFHYPLRGPGMMWQRIQEAIGTHGGQILLNSEVIGLKQEHRSIVSVTYRKHNTLETIPVEHLIASLPITELPTLLEPKVPHEVLEAACNLAYRAFLIVVLILDKEELFQDQWIYVHDSNVQVGRIQNFKNWSLAMVSNPQTTSIGMEYFCTEGDELWRMDDAELVAVAAEELSKLRLAQADDVIDAVVLRQPKAYPIYTHDYRIHLNVLRNFLATISNFQTIGRNGLYRYNNQDHSMLTGILAAQNIFGAQHSIWDVNEEKTYLEEKSLSEQVLIRTFARLDKLAFAIAAGTVAGLLMFLVTFLPFIRSSTMLIPYLQLLGQYFIGYTVSITGAFIAFGYSFLWGFFCGWLFACLRNLFLGLYILKVKKEAEVLSLRDFLDYI